LWRENKTANCKRVEQRSVFLRNNSERRAFNACFITFNYRVIKGERHKENAKRIFSRKIISLFCSRAKEQRRIIKINKSFCVNFTQLLPAAGSAQAIILISFIIAKLF